MTNTTRLIGLALAAALSGAALAQVPTIDGQRDAQYIKLGAQNTQTNFGDNNLGVIDLSNGSEADNIYYVRTNDTLYLFIGGNLGADAGVFNKFALFFDTGAGGYNRLPAGLPDIDFNRFQRMGDDGTGNGLTFDTGFNATHFIAFVAGGNPVGVFVNYSQVETVANGGTAAYLGMSSPGSDGTLMGGNNPNNVRGTINNSNIAGVDGGTGTFDPNVADLVATGIEIAIPLAQIGNPTGPIKVNSFVFSDGYDFLSNQVLGGIGGGDNLADPRLVNFSTIGDDQFFTVPPLASNEEIFPTSFNRLRGRVDAGDVNSLRGDDNNRLRVCRFIVPNDPNRIIEVDYIGATTIASPTSFKLDVRSRSTVGGLVQQTLQVFNYQTNAFDTTDFNQVNVNTTLTTRTVTGTGSVARLVGGGGALRAKQTFRIVGPVPNPNVCKETTLVRWTIGG